MTKQPRMRHPISHAGSLVSNDTQVKTVTKPKKQIKMLIFNARSPRNKIEELKCLVLTANIDVIAVNGTL